MTEQAFTFPTVQVQQPLCLTECQRQTRHFQILAANAAEEVVVPAINARNTILEAGP